MKTLTRKPAKTLRVWDGEVSFVDTEQYGPICQARLYDGTTAEARRLASWLIRFADWADEVKFARKKAKKKGRRA